MERKRYTSARLEKCAAEAQKNAAKDFGDRKDVTVECRYGILNQVTHQGASVCIARVCAYDTSVCN